MDATVITGPAEADGTGTPFQDAAECAGAGDRIAHAHVVLASSAAMDWKAVGTDY